MNNRKKPSSKGFKANRAKARKINAQAVMNSLGHLAIFWPIVSELNLLIAGIRSSVVINCFFIADRPFLLIWGWEKVEASK